MNITPYIYAAKRNGNYSMDITFNKNEDHNKLRLSELKKHLSKAKLGGGKARIEKHHSQGK